MYLTRKFPLMIHPKLLLPVFICLALTANAQMEPKPVFVYSFELNQAGDAFYDQSSDSWVLTIPSQNAPTYFSFTYTLKNKIATRTGKISGDIDGLNLFPDPEGSDEIGVIAPDQNITGKFRSLVVKPGSYTIRFKYEIHESYYNKLLRRYITNDSLAAEAIFTLVVKAQEITDNDHDGIDDLEENRLIEKFRPYYKFTLNNGRQEDYRPVDALEFVRNSTLIYYQNSFDPLKLNVKSGEVRLDLLEMSSNPEKAISLGP